MNTFKITNELSRRQWMAVAAGGLAAGLVPLTGRADGDRAPSRRPNTPTAPLATTAISGKKVVVVGGGMAGMTAAKYLRLWGGKGLEVTLVEPEALYTSSIMSNLVLNGSRTIAGLQYSRETLARRYGVVARTGRLTAINRAARSLTLSDGSSLGYDRLVLAPGISFDDAYGLTTADYDARTPHAWRGGAQTTLLRQQITAMQDRDIFVMTIPKAPYRCPPGPYERACVVADHLKSSGRAGCQVVVLDENPVIQAERHTFETAFAGLHAGVIRYIPNVTGIQIDPASKVVTYVDGVGGTQVINARVVNPIVPHRAAGSEAGGWLAQAGLNNSADGRWAMVNVLSYESTLVGAEGIHVIGDASSCGMPKAGHVANQEAKICADAIIRLLSGAQPDPQPVANSACYSPITASSASWLTAVYQYDPIDRRMKIASNGGQTLVNGVAATATEAASVSQENFKDMGTWFNTLMKDTLA
ncbi:FAD-dependent oxidoreductase [Hydrogenophaga luteola]|uniref:FAD-dependent oxidoreductase n=1 Tax=Hydrogenophaga luteola TaxID=1591122 RepID=A0ABV7VYE7_9BURK